MAERLSSAISHDQTCIHHSQVLKYNLCYTPHHASENEASLGYSWYSHTYYSLLQLRLGVSLMPVNQFYSPVPLFRRHKIVPERGCRRGRGRGRGIDTYYFDMGCIYKSAEPAQGYLEYFSGSVNFILPRPVNGFSTDNQRRSRTHLYTECRSSRLIYQLSFPP